ncbi:MAG: ATP-binding protein [bacterium]|nr:ATP-binding protein [bacterium]
MSNSEQKKKFKLRPRARIVKTFGEELISNDYVAIIELVKNSYDADARVVDITFSGPLEKGLGGITIKDNGLGMSPTDVQEGWMEPASISKLVKRKSHKGRAILGEKGIGRFSTAKLADKLTLITRKEEFSEVVAHFVWSDFYDPKKYLDEIEGWWETRSPQEIKKTGTILLLEGLQSSWDESRIKELKTYLRRLINPLRPPKDFKINLNLPKEYEKYTGEITPSSSMQKPDYLSMGVLDNYGKLLVEYHSKQNPKKKILNNDVIILESGKKPECGPITFEFRVWDRDKFKDLAVELGVSSNDIRQDLNEIAGINIFRDGFRVSPYGNPQNDWLRLDIRRVQNPTLRISNNQIVGDISITRNDNPELKDQTNREGIVESDAFKDLQEVTKTILTFLEKERYVERRMVEESPTDNKHRLFNDINLDSVRNVVEKKLPGDKEAQAAIVEKEIEIKKRVEEFRDFIVRYRRLSTLGQLVDVVLHDAGAGLSRVINGLAVIDKEVKKTGTFSEKAKQNLAHATHGSSMLSELFKRLEPFGGRRREKSKLISIEAAIKDVFEIYASEISDVSAEISLPTTNTKINISESDFKMVFVNLLNNSLYWLKKVSKEKRKIVVTVKSSDENVEIIFSDSGPGIPKEDEPFIFDPYYTKKPDGIGLGLTIVGEFVTEQGGVLDLIEKGPLTGANFRIKIPLN